MRSFLLSGGERNKMKNLSPLLKFKVVNIIMLALITISLTAIFVTQAASRKVDEKEYYILPIEGLNLRSNPSINAKLIESLPYGTRVKASLRISDWALVGFKEKEGWVRAEFLTEQPPVELSVKSLKGEDLIHYNSDVENLLPPYYQDYNGDGREDVMFAVQKDGNSGAKKFYIYGHKGGYVLTKYAEISPEKTPGYYANGYRGGDSLIYSEGKSTLVYPLYADTDALCCPSGGEKVVEIEI